MRRPNIQALATLVAVLPALAVAISSRLHGEALGLSADFWRGAVIGVCIGLQVLAIAYLARLARPSCGPFGWGFRRGRRKDEG